MSATVHRLPGPVPEGWEPSDRWENEWTRQGWAGGVGFGLGVRRESGLFWPDFMPDDETLCHPTLDLACAAAERAYCGCHVRSA